MPVGAEHLLSLTVVNSEVETPFTASLLIIEHYFFGKQKAYAIKDSSSRPCPILYACESFEINFLEFLPKQSHLRCEFQRELSIHVSVTFYEQFLHISFHFAIEPLAVSVSREPDAPLELSVTFTKIYEHHDRVDAPILFSSFQHHVAYCYGYIENW